MSRDREGLPLEGTPVSVVIPTYGRRESLGQVLNGLESQTYPAGLIEVIVVCDGDRDGTGAMLTARNSRSRLRIFHQPNRGPAAARNRALREARGPVVLFLDDDVIPTPCCVSEHVRLHQERPDLVVIGPLLPPLGRLSAWGHWEAMTLEKQYRELGAGRWQASARQFYTGNASLRLEHLRAVGGFNEDFRRAEDVELGLRLRDRGLRFAFHPEAAGIHLVRRPFRAWLRNAYHYGQADVLIAREHPEILRAAAAEFQTRHPYTRRFVCWALRHRRVGRACSPAGRVAAQLARTLGRERISYALCSAMFSANYWYGLSDQLGGYAAAQQLLTSAREARSVRGESATAPTLSRVD